MSQGGRTAARPARDLSAAGGRGHDAVPPRLSCARVVDPVIIGRRNIVQRRVTPNAVMNRSPACTDDDKLMSGFVGRNGRADLLLAAIAMLVLLPMRGHAHTAVPPGGAIWTVPAVGALPDDDYGRLVRRGRDLVTATYSHIGPEMSDPLKRYAGNNLACGDCHLEAGTKRFGLPIFGLYDVSRNTARGQALRSRSKSA